MALRDLWSSVICGLDYIYDEIKYKKKEELTISVFVKSEGIPSPNGHQLLLPLPKTLVHHTSNTVRLCGAPDHRIEPRPRRRVEQIITERREVRSGEDLAEWSWSGIVDVLVVILAVGAAEDEGSVKIQNEEFARGGWGGEFVGWFEGCSQIL